MRGARPWPRFGLHSYPNPFFYVAYGSFDSIAARIKCGSEDAIGVAGGTDKSNPSAIQKSTGRHNGRSMGD